MLAEDTTRKERAQNEYDSRNIFPLTREDFYRVKGNGGVYTVDSRGGFCTCPDFQKRKEQCKHIYMVEMYRKGARSMTITQQQIAAIKEWKLNREKKRIERWNRNIERLRITLAAR